MVQQMAEQQETNDGRMQDNHHDDDDANNQSLHQFNMELNRLAEQCGNFDTEDVVSTAMQCQEMFEQHYNNSASEQGADVCSFNTVLKAWSKAAATMTKEYRQGHPAPRQVKQHGVPVYTARDAAERATRLLMDMEHQVQQGNTAIVPNTHSYNAAIDAWAKSHASDAPQVTERLLKKLMDHETLEPDTLSYNGVLNAWASSDSRQAMPKIHAIYEKMKTLELEGKENSNVRPTIRTINTMIHAHGKRIHTEPSIHHAREAHQLLKETKLRYQETGDEDYQPDATTYTTVMDAYGRLGTLEATLEAEKLLEECKVAYKETKLIRLQPTSRTYTSLIMAWSKIKHAQTPEKGEALLEEMKRLGYEAVQPTTRTYTAVIQCWGRSNDPRKAQQALRILKDMREQYRQGGDVRPNVLTYNAAIEACAMSAGDAKRQTEALKIAFAMLKSLELEQHMEPNQHTYSTLIKACSQLLPPGPERDSVAKAVFQKACKAGMVDYQCLTVLRRTVHGQTALELLQPIYDETTKYFDFDKAPHEWKRNAVLKKRR